MPVPPACEPPAPAAPAPAQPPAPIAESGPLVPVSDSHLVVGLSGALYAIPIRGIEEILPMREVAPLPRSAPAVRGVLFLRGHPVTVLDLAVLLGLAPGPGSRIVVVVIEREHYGLVVDAVLKVASPGSLVDPVPPPAALGVSPALRAVARLGEEIVSLLDLDPLIPAPVAARAGA